MNGIQEAREKMKKKMSLSDYSKPSKSSAKHQSAKDSRHSNDKTPECENVEVSRQQDVKKFKTTVYLPEEENRMLNEIYSERLLSNNKTDRSALLCEAIRIFYKSQK